MSVVLETQLGDSHYEELVDFITQLISTEIARLTESQEAEAAQAIKDKEGFKTFSNTAKAALNDKKHEEFIKQVISAAEFISKDSRHYTSVFQVLASFIAKHAQSEEHQMKLAQPIIDFALNNTTCTLAMRFKALAVLFNIFTNTPNFRAQILKSILELALKTKKTTVVLPHLVNLQSHFDALEADFKKKVDISKVALKIADSLEEKNNTEKFDVYYNFLTLLDTNFDKTLFSENKNEIKNIILNLLKKFPRNIDFNRFLNLKSIKELETSDKPLYELLTLAVSGDLNSYHKWKTTNANFFSQSGLDESIIEERVTLSTFYKMAETNKRITLTDLAKSLKLKDDFDAEFWVIKAIQKGELEGKIDENEGVLNITNVNQQSFHSSEWKELENRLGGFKQLFQQFADTVKQGIKI